MLKKFTLYTFLLLAAAFMFSLPVSAKTVKINLNDYAEGSGEEESEDEYTHGTGKIDMDTIQNALNKALEGSPRDKYIVTVPKGTYKFTHLSGLHIYSNTTLRLKGVTLKKLATNGPGAMIQVGYPRNEPGKSSASGGGYTKGGYTRGKNIRVIGGTFDAGSYVDGVSTLCTFSHVEDISFEGVTFKYRPKKFTTAHMIEFGAAKNVKLKNCAFIGNQNVDEAVQIESARKGVASSDLMGKLDGTKTKNVQITGCRFKSFRYGMGTNHGCAADVYTGFVIKNNTFEGISKYAICVYNYKGAKILNNKMKNCKGSAILKLR